MKMTVDLLQSLKLFLGKICSDYFWDWYRSLNIELKKTKEELQHIYDIFKGDFTDANLQNVISAMFAKCI